MERLDILNREPFVDSLLQLTENISQSKTTVSFAIDGVWGCGKSFVLDMFEEELEQIQSEETATDKYLIIRYNCWQYDYYEEPLVAIVATLMDTINKKTKLLSAEQCEEIKSILKASGAALLFLPTNIIDIDLNELKDIVKKGFHIGKENHKKLQKYDTYFDFKKILCGLQNVINEISKRYTLVFLVDELDRCMPEYSIKVLECLHHLTENTKNVINIMAIDKEQLQTSVCHIFGFDNANEYLKKFIQFTIPLDLGKTSEKVIDKYSDYIVLFDKTLFPVRDSIEEFLQAVFVNIGAREQERLMRRAMVVHKLLYTAPKDYSFMCVEILIVVLESKYKYIKRFTKWLQQVRNGIEAGKDFPPFSDFFEKKFKEVPCDEITYRGSYNKIEYSLQYTDSLYGAIACIWYEMFLKNPNRVVSAKNEILSEMMKNNAEELMRFSNTIKLIQ